VKRLFEFVGVLAALVTIIWYWQTGRWQRFDPRATKATIVAVENPPGSPQGGRLVSVSVRCSHIHHDRHLWLVVTNTPRPATGADVQYYPEREIDCGTRTTDFYIGSISSSDEGLWDIRLYEVDGRRSKVWVAYEGHHANRSEWPSTDPLSLFGYRRSA
jgi:hypothetical protein